MVGCAVEESVLVAIYGGLCVGMVGCGIVQLWRGRSGSPTRSMVMRGRW